MKRISLLFCFALIALTSLAQDNYPVGLITSEYDNIVTYTIDRTVNTNRAGVTVDVEYFDGFPTFVIFKFNSKSGSFTSSVANDIYLSSDLFGEPREDIMYHWNDVVFLFTDGTSMNVDCRLVAFGNNENGKIVPDPETIQIHVVNENLLEKMRSASVSEILYRGKKCKEKIGFANFNTADAMKAFDAKIKELATGHSTGSFKYEGKTYNGGYYVLGGNAIPHGWGMHYNESERYAGEFKDGKKCGKGVLKYANGWKYSGDFENDDCEGVGELVHDKGDTYKGQFHNGQCHGQGTATYSNGNKYTGSWENGTWNGPGKAEYYTGEKVEGTFVDGKPHGKCTLYYKDGHSEVHTLDHGRILD